MATSKNSTTKNKGNNKGKNSSKTEIVKTKEKKVFVNEEVTNLLKIILGVTAFFLIFYLITYVITKDKKEDTPAEDIYIQYNEIFLSKLLTQNTNEYYVLLYDKEDRFYSVYDSYLYTYKMKEDSKKIYTSLLNNGFNKPYIAEESNTKINNIDDLRVNDVTLFRIKDKKIANVYEGKDAVLSELEKISK